MPIGPFNPETREAFTTAPDVVYSPILSPFTTNRSDPESAMSYGPLNPETKEAFTTAPDVVYSPIVLALRFVTNRSDPDTAMSHGSLNPETREAFTTAPDVVYSPIVPMTVIRDKQVRSGHGNALRTTQPRDQRGVYDCTRRGVFANRTCRRNLRQTGSIRTRQCQPDHSTPRPGSGSRLLPTWCIRQSCRRCYSQQTGSIQTRQCHTDNSPRDQGGFTTAPDVVYSPIVPFAVG